MFDELYLYNQAYLVYHTQMDQVYAYQLKMIYYQKENLDAFILPQVTWTQDGIALYYDRSKKEAAGALDWSPMLWQEFLKNLDSALALGKRYMLLEDNIVLSDQTCFYYQGKWFFVCLPIKEDHGMRRQENLKYLQFLLKELGMQQGYYQCELMASMPHFSLAGLVAALRQQVLEEHAPLC